MIHFKKMKKSIKKLGLRYHRYLLMIEMILIQLIGKPVYAAGFTPPQNFLDGVQWVVLAGQFFTVCFAVIQLGPIAWSFMRKNQQKVEEGKDHATHVAIGIAIAFVGLWVVKTYIETIGGTYPLPF